MDEDWPAAERGQPERGSMKPNGCAWRRRASSGLRGILKQHPVFAGSAEWLVFIVACVLLSLKFIIIKTEMIE